ncbi:hypothetical protein U9M48_026898 [Paspalum notatum var. saurae]|uniref:AP2/ERF domain-containing protein n=1 Tax=Paspalum notatum var. saurae TaxID=547442 RepID=A0AAQ3WYR8_PASNO
MAERTDGAFYKLVRKVAATARAHREATGQSLPPPPSGNYRGVRPHYGKFGAEIRDPVNSKHVWLGTFPTAEEAAYAYDIAARTVQGQGKARTNFPEPLWEPGYEDDVIKAVLDHFDGTRCSRVARAEKRARLDAVLGPETAAAAQAPVQEEAPAPDAVLGPETAAAAAAQAPAQEEAPAPDAPPAPAQIQVQVVADQRGLQLQKVVLALPKPPAVQRAPVPATPPPSPARLDAAEAAPLLKPPPFPPQLRSPAPHLFADHAAASALALEAAFFYHPPDVADLPMHATDDADDE